MESFFNTLKQIFLYRHEFRSEAELKASLSEFTHYYNSKRIHEYLGYKTPEEACSLHIIELLPA
ncbi:integrase core domain-containing protein [Candidatus Saccharibacteria bacterium]|nr:integrase core domain-containing protein [Candidatus Saccharibacteria bacterium]